MRQTLRKLTGRDSALREILKVLGIWLKGRILIWLSVTGLYLFGFAVARAPLWILLALLCGFVDAIPHFGMIFSLILTLAFSIIGSAGETPVILAALAVWLLVQVTEIFVIAPRVLGRKLGLSPWLVLLGGIAGGLIGGPIGVLAATPVMAAVAVIWRRTRRKDAAKY